MRFIMKEQWLEVVKKIDDLERTDKLNWKELSKKKLNMILINQHRRDRKHWVEPASYELNRRRHFWLICVIHIDRFNRFTNICVL